MKRVMRKKILIGLALAVFCLFGMASNGMAAPLVLPDPNTYFSPDIQTHHYFAWAHDDFWSFSAALLALTVDPVWDSIHGSNGVTSLNIFTNGNAQPAAGMPPPAQETGNPNNPYHVLWGLPVGTSPISMPPYVGYLNNNNRAIYGPTGGVTVGQMLAFLQLGATSNDTIPVFGLGVQAPQNGALAPFAFGGHVFFAESNGTPVQGYDWALDQKAQTDTGNNSPPLSGNPDRTGTRTLHPTTQAQLDAMVDADFPGFDTIGTYDVNTSNNDPNYPGTVIPLEGSAWLRYVAYAPTMDLKAITNAHPDLLNKYFAVEFTVGNDHFNQNGTVHAFLFQDVLTKPPQVPEPATLLLLGLGLIGLAGIRRKLH